MRRKKKSFASVPSLVLRSKTNHQLFSKRRGTYLLKENKKISTKKASKGQEKYAKEKIKASHRKGHYKALVLSFLLKGVSYAKPLSFPSQGKGHGKEK